MNKIYWTIVALIAVFGISFAVYFGAQPRSIQKIKYSEVSDPAELGKAVYTRLREEIRQAPILFLGVTPDSQEDYIVWRSFLENNQDPGYKYDLVSIEPMLPYKTLIPFGGEIDIKTQGQQLLEGLKNAQASKIRTVFILPSIYISQLIKENPIAMIKKDLNVNLTTIAITKFPRTREDEAGFDPACVTENDIRGTGALGCAIFESARKSYRKKHDPKKYSAILDQVGLSDYLFLINPPVEK